MTLMSQTQRKRRFKRQTKCFVHRNIKILTNKAGKMEYRQRLRIIINKFESHTRDDMRCVHLRSKNNQINYRHSCFD